MATFRKRNDKWHVQVRRAGHPSQSKSFISKSDAINGFAKLKAIWIKPSFQLIHAYSNS